jgi:hypothetical protein
MPRTIEPELSMVLERANPSVCHFVEVNAPDVGKVLRRAADLFLSPVSQTPASSITADPAGALTIVSSAATLATFTSENDETIALPRSNPTATYIRGFVFGPDESFGRAVLREFLARIKRKNSDTKYDLALQIYRMQGDAVVGATPGTPAIRWSFVPLLPHAVRYKHNEADWVSNKATVKFDLTSLRFEFGRANVPYPTANHAGEVESYIFVIQPENAPADDLYYWIRDTATARIDANGAYGDFYWVRGNAEDPTGWIPDPVGLSLSRVPCATIKIEDFLASAQAVYAITLASVPLAASAGRIMFERGVPAGATATLELSTAGTGGPWTAVTHGAITSA